VTAIVVGELIAGSGVVVDPADPSRLGVPARPTNALLTTNSPPSFGDSVEVTVLSQYRDEQRDLVASLEILALAVLALALLIAIVRVGATAALSVVERRRESGMLRAIGLSRLTLGGITVSEAALHGVLGVLFGLTASPDLRQLNVEFRNSTHACLRAGLAGQALSLRFTTKSWRAGSAEGCSGRVDFSWASTSSASQRS
jgi:hypothetical protein